MGRKQGISDGRDLWLLVEIKSQMIHYILLIPKLVRQIGPYNNYIIIDYVSYIILWKNKRLDVTNSAACRVKVAREEQHVFQLNFATVCSRHFRRLIVQICTADSRFGKYLKHIAELQKRFKCRGHHSDDLGFKSWYTKLLVWFTKFFYLSLFNEGNRSIQWVWAGIAGMIFICSKRFGSFGNRLDFKWEIPLTKVVLLIYGLKLTNGGFYVAPIATRIGLCINI